MVLKLLHRVHTSGSVGAHAILEIVFGHGREVVFELFIDNFAVFVGIHEFLLDNSLLGLDLDPPVLRQVVDDDIGVAPAVALRVKLPPVGAQELLLLVLVARLGPRVLTYWTEDR